MSEKGIGARRSANRNGYAHGYDADLVNAEALAVCDHYLGGRRREGRRYVYTCPECAKPDFEVEPVRGMAGCFNPICSMPKTTEALGVISHLEGIERRGAEFIRCMEKGYEILGLAAPERDAHARTTGGTKDGARKHAASNGSAKGASAARPAPDEPVPGRPRARTWVRQNGADGSVEERPGRPATRGERVYPVEAYLEGPDGERIPAEAVIVEEGDPRINDSLEEGEDPPGLAKDLSPEVDPPAPAGGQGPADARVLRMPGPGPEEAATSDERGLRHAVYERLLALCPLEERDARFFKGRGLDPGTVEEGRFGSISARRSQWAAERLSEVFGEDLLRVPGFYRPEGQPGRVRFSLYGDYALIPYHDAEGYITTVEGRLIGEPKNPRDRKYKALLGSGVHLYVHPRFAPGEVVAFCEGAIGAMVAARYGIPVAAIKGFRNYKVSAREVGAEDRALPELGGVDFAGREVVYIPDVDVKPASREEVMGAVPAACEWLVARQGGVPKVALLPEGAKDLDQWLLSLPEPSRVAEAHRLLSGAVGLDEWAASRGEGQHRHDADGRGASDATRTAREGANERRPTDPRERPAGPTGGKRDLLGDDAPAAGGTNGAATAAPEPDPRVADDAPTRRSGRDAGGGDAAPRNGADRGGREADGQPPTAHDAERARKGPMHPSMTRWYEVAGYSDEQVERARRQTAVRKVTGRRRPPVRDTPVRLPRWTPGDVVLALALAPAVAVALCLLAYAIRSQPGALGVAGDLLTWPSWWFEMALYAWAGALAANWTVGRRHRTRRHQLAAHLRGEE